jgi:hypothetical protein
MFAKTRLAHYRSVILALDVSVKHLPARHPYPPHSPTTLTLLSVTPAATFILSLAKE